MITPESEIRNLEALISKYNQLSKEYDKVFSENYLLGKNIDSIELAGLSKEARRILKRAIGRVKRIRQNINKKEYYKTNNIRGKLLGVCVRVDKCLEERNDRRRKEVKKRGKRKVQELRNKFREEAKRRSLLEKLKLRKQRFNAVSQKKAKYGLWPHGKANVKSRRP